MKTKILILFCFVLITSVGYSQDPTVKEITEIANSGFRQYLEKIPPGRESNYGFKNREEFGIAQIGKPYQILLLKKEFYVDSVLKNTDYLVPGSEWRVVIKVNNENRACVTVAKMNGIWKVVGIGAAGLASELGSFEKRHPSAPQKGKIVRVLSLDCEFILLPIDSIGKDIQTYFLKSADLVFDQSPDKETLFPLQQTLLMVKNKAGNK